MSPVLGQSYTLLRTEFLAGNFYLEFDSDGDPTHTSNGFCPGLPSAFHGRGGARLTVLRFSSTVGNLLQLKIREKAASITPNGAEDAGAYSTAFPQCGL